MLGSILGSRYLGKLAYQEYRGNNGFYSNCIGVIWGYTWDYLGAKKRSNIQWQHGGIRNNNHNTLTTKSQALTLYYPLYGPYITHYYHNAARSVVSFLVRAPGARKESG